MTYNASIPQPTDLISVSQGQILTNFTQLNAQFGGSTPSTGGDHDGFNNGSGNGSGMHNQVTFTANQSAPSLTRNGTTGVSGLYVNTVSAASQLFFQNGAGSTQLTGVSSKATIGYAFLPGGFLIQWGNVTATNNVTIGFPTTFPTACVNVQITTLGFTNPGTLVNVAPTPVQTGFTPMVKTATTGSTASPIQIFYLAIGY